MIKNDRAVKERSKYRTTLPDFLPLLIAEWLQGYWALTDPEEGDLIYIVYVGVAPPSLSQIVKSNLESLYPTGMAVCPFR